MLGYSLFLLATGVMLVRPMDLDPGMATMPLYEMLIIPAILISFAGLIDELSPTRLAQTPTSVCILGILGVHFISLLLNGLLAGNPESLFEQSKVVVLYLLLLAVVTTPGRLRGLLMAIVVYDVLAATIAVLHYHGYIHVTLLKVLEFKGEEIDPTRGTWVVEHRLAGLGSFSDPNDLCELMAVGLAVGVGLLMDRRSGMLRWLWLAPMALLAYTVVLTQSRGGLLAVLAGLAALLQARLRSRKMLIGLGLLAFLGLGILKGRQGSFDLQSGTGLGRMELWAESLPLFRSSPIYGIGPGQVLGYLGHVAHNAFIQAFAELGILGGAFHFGAYYYVLRTLWRLGSLENRPADPQRQQLPAAAFGALAAYFVGEQSLTHPYSVATMLFLGMGTAAIRICQPVPPLPDTRLSVRMLAQFFGLGLAYYLFLVFFAKFNAHW